MVKVTTGQINLQDGNAIEIIIKVTSDLSLIAEVKIASMTFNTYQLPNKKI
jgi:hypothetical protein